MAISYLTPPQEIGIAEANAVFDALDDALRVLFNSQSPLLYLPNTGPSSCRESGLLGVLCVFGTMGSRRILSAVASHDQTAIDSAVAAATRTGQDDDLKQITLDLTTGYLGKSLVAHQVLATPPVGPDELYWVRQEFVSGSYQHEHLHELAVVDVVFEGHASRSFTWLEEWNKFRCIRFHNLDQDVTPLVVTMESTGDTISLDRWQTKTVRLSADGTSWEEIGFLLWRMREDDLARFGGTMPWNDRRRAEAGTMDTVWTSDGANNVASWALVWWIIDYFSTPQTPSEVADECGGGIQNSFDKRTGFHFDLSDITHNAGELSPFPDPTESATELYKLALHGGRMTVVTTNLDASQEIVTTSTNLATLLAGDATANLKLNIGGGGSTATLDIIDTTGIDYIDVIPTGTSLGASGNPFEVPTSGYAVPVFMDGTWSGIKRWAEDTTITESVVGIGTIETTDYNPLQNENASDGSSMFSPFDVTIGDLTSWTFASSGTKNNDYSTFMSNSAKWDGRRVSVNSEVEVFASDGRYPSATSAAEFNGASVIQETFQAEDLKLNWFQCSTIQDWPHTGGIWFTPSYARRAKSQLTTVPPLAHPHVAGYTGNADGDDWVARSTTSLSRSSGPVSRQSGIDLDIESPPLSTCYFKATDQTEYIVSHVNGSGWWAANRADAIANNPLSGDAPLCIAPVIMARHYNVLAQRLNCLLTVYPFSFFDAQYYGTDFAPQYGDVGIFGGYIYPAGFVCYNLGATATKAAALSITVTDFQTEFAAFDLTDVDITGVYGSGTPTVAFDPLYGTGWNAWNKDLPYWFRPDASVTLNENSTIYRASPGSGWVIGGFAFTDGVDDWYWWQKDNPSEFDFPDFEYITAGSLDAFAASVGIPFRLFRLSAGWTIYGYTPDRVGLGGRVVPVEGGGTATRTEYRLVPKKEDAPFVSFAGTNETWWGSSGLVRLSDWPVCPATQGSDDATVQMSNADPMHGLNRSGSGDVILYPWGYRPASGSPTGTWTNDCPFEAEARYLQWEQYDSTPSLPSGWSADVNRLAVYPVPITQWGATDIESQAHPDCNAANIPIADVPQEFEASDLWNEIAGSAWPATGAFAVHLLPAGILAP